MRAKYVARRRRLIVTVRILLSTAWLTIAADQPARAASVAIDTSPDKSPILLLASANDSVRPTIAAGWPIVVRVHVRLRPNAGGSLTLSNPAGPWSDALALECTAANGSDCSSLFSPAYASERSIELTRERSGLMVWILDAVDPGTLPEGALRIRAVLDEKKLGGALADGMTSSPVTVTITKESSAPSAVEARGKCLATMNAARWKKDPARALATAATHLAAHPKDVAVLVLQGQIQRAQGQKAEALASFESALAAAEENKVPGAENFAIERLVAKMRDEIAPP